MSRHCYVFLAVLILALTGFGVSQEVPANENTNAYREFALTHRGDAKVGEELFSDAKTQCANCHGITGLEKSGPNLDGIGEKYTLSDLIAHILEPSLAIMPG